MKHNVCVVCVLVMLNSYAIADHKQVISAKVGYGVEGVNFHEAGGTNGDVGQLGFDYQFIFNKYWSLEAGYHYGFGLFESIFIGILSEIKEIDYQNMTLSITGHLPLNDRNELYASVGGNGYKVNYDLDFITDTQTGIGWQFKTGWAYNFNNDWGLFLELGYVYMGDLYTTIGSIGLSYRFN